MVTLLKKQDVLDLLDAMPEEIDVEELHYRLYLFQQIAAERQRLAPVMSCLRKKSSGSVTSGCAGSLDPTDLSATPANSRLYR